MDIRPALIAIVCMFSSRGICGTSTSTSTATKTDRTSFAKYCDEKYPPGYTYLAKCDDGKSGLKQKQCSLNGTWQVVVDTCHVVKK